MTAPSPTDDARLTEIRADAGANRRYGWDIEDARFLLRLHDGLLAALRAAQAERAAALLKAAGFNGLLASEGFRAEAAEQESDAWARRYDDAEGRCKILLERAEAAERELAAEKATLECYVDLGRRVAADLAEAERERDEAQNMLDGIVHALNIEDSTDEPTDAIERLYDRVEAAERERDASDQALEMQTDTYVKMQGIADDLKRERDALREALVRTKEQLGEAIHAAFRKASDHHQADKVWQAIRDWPDDDWRRVLGFITYGLGIDAALVKEE